MTQNFNNFNKGKKAVLFDLDGTLVNSLPLIFRNCKEVFEALNIPWNDGEVMNWVGIPLRQIAEYFAKDQVEEYLKIYQECFCRDHDLYIELYPHTVEMLKTLRKNNFKIALVTSKGKPATTKTFDLMELNQYFDVLVTAHDVKIHKPNPEPIYKALELLGLSPKEAIFVGDSPYDLEAGNKASVDTLGVSWGMAKVEALEEYHPLGILNTWEDLYVYL